MPTLPLEGLTVLEFTHAVMGPTTGLLLADMGAEVIHIEPPEGDSTRRLKGFGSGYFSFYNRNKESLAADLKTEAGKALVYRLAEKADIVVENFGPGTMDRLGFGYAAMQAINPGIIYCSLKGFLSGPYEKRHAMDEVVQMMGGLAYMTGRPGDPLRAGTSIVDIAGGMFGYIGILLALYERQQTGKGKFVKAALFETTAFLMGQHMAYAALGGSPVPPMPARVSAWSIYQIFRSSDGEQVFIGIISEKHWARLCEVFSWQDFASDPRLQTNNDRIEQREWFLPEVEKRLKVLPQAEIIARCEAAELPFAPVARPEDLFEDPHLNSSKRLLETELPDGTHTKLPAFPLEYGNTTPALHLSPPQIGEHTRDLLLKFGFSMAEIKELEAKKVINTPL
jgi:crotonobetainyl-CoA:carnitine CoA-transferase CaiB-like acyl-CoA transferase